MEQEKTFVLLNKKHYRRSLNIFVVGGDGKVAKRNITFSTERLVNIIQRADVARTIAAEYYPINKAESDALLSSPAYGKTFVRKDDPEGKLKLPTRLISTEDAEKAGLKILFELAGLDFNQQLPLEVLKSMYANQVQALAGSKKVVESPPATIPSTPVDVAKNINDAVRVAKAKFEEKYGYPVPEIVANDLAFIDGISNPEFDAEGYIASKQSKQVVGEDIENLIDAGGAAIELTIDELRQKYFDKFGTNVANIKKNDAGWIKAKLAE
jgi:hypothetical protein